MDSCVLSIAGFDPSGGAGILADIKTFETHKVLSMGVVSSLTIQNDTEFVSLTWFETEEILKQIAILNKKFTFKIVKVGLIKNLEVLATLVFKIKEKQPKCLIVWDPIIKATAGFEFHKSFDRKLLLKILENIFLITPNTDEIMFLAGNDNAKNAAEDLKQYCHVLLKGGHNIEEPGVDYLFTKNEVVKINPKMKEVFPKHGSGCVLSSAIASNLLVGNDLITSCNNAKKYVEYFLSSNKTLLGTHHAY